MTDYFSNRMISEAYSKMYEGAEHDGTISDSRKYRVAVNRVAEDIMEDIIDALGSDDYGENEKRDSFDCTPLTYMPLRVETDIQIAPERLRSLILDNRNFFEDEIADFLESSNAVRVSTLIDHKDHLKFTLTRTVTIPLRFEGMYDNNIAFRIIVSEGYIAIDSRPRKKIFSDVSRMFRKNLRKPDFPDSVSES